MKFIVLRILKGLSKAVVKKYQPKIIAITGSVGKTSTKTAVSLILEKKHNIRSSYKNYNSEFGVPLTILNQRTAFKSTIGWNKVIWAGIKLLLFKDGSYPDTLIIEAGVGKPNDMKYLGEIITPDILIVTGIDEMPVHMEHFKNREAIAREKFLLVKKMKETGTIIYNDDNDLSQKYAKKYQGKLNLISYGLSESANIKIESPSLLFNQNTKQIGYNFKISHKGVVTPLFIPNLLGTYQLYPLAAAIAVGLSMKQNFVEMSGYLRSYKLPPGRMNILKGIKKSMIIDDTYNSSPSATINAISSLQAVSQYLNQNGTSTRKVMILGDMLELGENSKKAHQSIADKVVQIADFVFLVGEEVGYTMEKMVENGFETDKIKPFTDSESCANVIKDMITDNDLILVKGSQGMRMERIVEELVLEKDRIEELLVRQSVEWK